MNEGGVTRLHWMIAWRHLRAGDRPAAFVGPLALLAAYLIVVGLGMAGYAAFAEPSAAPVAPVLEVLGAPQPPPPTESFYGLFGGATLFVGAMLLLGGVLLRFFTLLATVIIVSVMLGCMALVVVLSLMTGLEIELRDKILGQLAHIRIARDDGKPFSDYAPVVEAVRASQGIVGASPYLQGEVMVRNGLNRQGGILTGIVPELHAEVAYLPSIVKEGEYRYLSDPAAIPDASFSFEILQDTAKEPEPAPALEPAPREPAPREPAPEVPAEPAAGDDDAWEDPVVEIPKLGDLKRGELKRGELGPRGKLAEDDWEDPESEASPAARRLEKKVGSAGGSVRGAATIKARGKVAAPPPAIDEEGWEDPESEIERLRAAGTLPPAKPGAGQGSGGEGDEPGETSTEAAAEADSEADSEDSSAVPGPVLIGSEKAKELIAHVGDRVQLITPIGRSTPAGRIPGVMAVRVAGIFDADHYEYDRWLVYAPLALVQTFLRTGDRISGIEVKVDDLQRIRERRDALRKLMVDRGFEGLVVRDWQELNESLFSAMALEKIAVFIALLCVILVASFGILGSNLMSVLEKSKEIAILKTMGCTDTLIQRVFIAEGLCMGIVGAILGIATGIALCLVLDAYGLPLSGDIAGFDKLPVSIAPLEVALVGVSALVIVWLSSLYPARVASRMRPVEALRKAEA